MLANKSMSNQQLANELHKPIIKKFKSRRVYSSFKYGIWAVDSADVQLISIYKGIRYLLCAIDLFSKYGWAVYLKGRKGITIVVLDSSKDKPNKICVDRGSEFYNILFKKWLKENHIEVYSTYNVFNVLKESLLLLKDLLQL